MSRLTALVSTLAALLIATAAISAPVASSRSPRRLTDLRDIGQLRTLFNAHRGEPRLIVLVSPT